MLTSNFLLKCEMSSLQSAPSEVFFQTKMSVAENFQMFYEIVSEMEKNAKFWFD